LACIYRFLIFSFDNDIKYSSEGVSTAFLGYATTLVLVYGGFPS
jgi:hypothetical protein